MNMSLPGKLCIGILQEDNPLKAYFRFKPLLVAEEGRYEPFDGASLYPEEGCIRIVPDKNEAYHFKTRMREIGLYCMVDLRAHPGEHDKIRPNKNHREGGVEANAYIIYSDVVREPLPEMLYEVLPEDSANGPGPAPHTPLVLLRGEAGLGGARYAWEAVESAGDQARLSPAGGECDVEKLQLFELEGFAGEALTVAVAPPPPAPERPARPASAEKPAPAEKSAAAEKPAPARESVPAAKPPAEGDGAPEAEIGPAEAPEPAEKPAPARDKPDAEDKPWLSHEGAPRASKPDPQLSPAQKALAVQSGLNPRRGRSLQEVIDEKWQHSRMSQLGASVEIPTGEPVASPVEGAVEAVRGVWRQTELRGRLLESLAGIEEFGASLAECREAARQRDIEEHLNGLEARRLALLDEMDRLRAGRSELRDQLKRELRREADGELAEALEKAEASKAELERCEQRAEVARAAADDAEKAVEALTGEALEQHIRDFALNRHILERLEELRGEHETPERVKARTEGPETLMARIQARFEAAGHPLEKAEAANLCACLAAGRMLILSGPVGCGKTETARQLSEALGWTAAGRYALFAPGRGGLEDHGAFRALCEQPEAPAMLVLDDANLHRTADPLRGLGAALEHPHWRLCLTVQDTHSGHPLPAATLDKGFMVRLDARADAPWGPRTRHALGAEAPVAWAQSGDQPEEAVPEACVAGMASLRAALGKLGLAVSVRALEEAWNYCGVMNALMGEDADPERILDLALAQRVLPGLLSAAPTPVLPELVALLERYPACRRLMSQPVPVML